MDKNTIRFHTDLTDLNEALEKASELQKILQEIRTFRAEDTNIVLELPVDVALQDGKLEQFFEKIEREMRKAGKHPHIEVKLIWG